MNIFFTKNTSHSDKKYEADKVFMENIDLLLNHQYDIYMKIEPQENLIAIDKNSLHQIAFGETRFSHYSSLSERIKDA